MTTGQDKGHGRKARGLLLEGLAEGGGEFGSPIVIEQAKELNGEPGGGFAVLKGRMKEGLAVSGVFDELMPVIGAEVRSDFGGAVEQSDGGGRGHEGQRPVAGLRGDGVVIQVEADAEGFVGVHRLHQVAGERVKGKREQAGLLLREDFGDGTGVIAGPGALVSDLVAPGEGLTVEVLQGGEGPGGEEAVTNILNGALHAPFFVAPRRAARTGGEVIVSGEFEPARMKVKGVALAFEDHAAEIIGGQGAGCSTPVVEGVDMTEEEVGQGLIKEEFQ